MNAADLPDSLEPLEHLVDAELGFQQRHFESLDTKAGIIVGFASAVVALAVDSPVAAGHLGGFVVPLAVVLAGSSAVLASTSFWPREFRVLDVKGVRDDALGRMPDSLTRVALLDTHVSVLTTNRAMLRTKVVRLKGALVALVGAVGLLAAGIVVDRLGGAW